MLLRILGLLFVLAAAGCNRGQTPRAAETGPAETPKTPSQDPPAASAQTPPAPASNAATKPGPAPEQQEDARPVLLAFGDSITAGYGVPPGQGYPELLQQLLEEKGYAYRVVNAGVSGDTTAGGLNRLDSLLALHPKIVILELGGNDGLRGIPVMSARQNLETLITRLQASGATVFLAGMTLPPNYGSAYIHSFEQVYADLAVKHHVTLIPFRLDNIGTAAEAPSLMQPDGIHPNAEGQKRIAAYLMHFLEPSLKR